MQVLTEKTSFRIFKIHWLKESGFYIAQNISVQKDSDSFVLPGKENACSWLPIGRLFPQLERWLSYPRLGSQPRAVYPEWLGWATFFRLGWLGGHCRSRDVPRGQWHLTGAGSPSPDLGTKVKCGGPPSHSPEVRSPGNCLEKIPAHFCPGFWSSFPGSPTPAGTLGDGGNLRNLAVFYFSVFMPW